MQIIYNSYKENPVSKAWKTPLKYLTVKLLSHLLQKP